MLVIKILRRYINLKKVLEIYVKLINKLLDLIIKICGKCEFVEKVLDNKFVRKIAPWVFIVKVIAIAALIIRFSCKSKCKCPKKK